MYINQVAAIMGKLNSFHSHFGYQSQSVLDSGHDQNKYECDSILRILDPWTQSSGLLLVKISTPKKFLL